MDLELIVNKNKVHNQEQACIKAICLNMEHILLEILNQLGNHI
jgi:hypothetical protein